MHFALHLQKSKRYANADIPRKVSRNWRFDVIGPNRRRTEVRTCVIVARRCRNGETINPNAVSGHAAFRNRPASLRFRLSHCVRLSRNI
jgi:hypothetical protein